MKMKEGLGVTFAIGQNALELASQAILMRSPIFGSVGKLMARL